MKYYLEIYEVTDMDAEPTVEAVKVEVTDKTNALSLLSTYEPAFSAVTYVKRFHTCKHEEGLPCEVEIL
jgi:hypothetical protein